MQSKTEARLHAQAAAYDSWARTPDRTARTAPARQAMDDRFVRAVDPDGVLSEEDRQQRVAAARRAYFTRLALAAVKARQRKVP